MIAEIYHKFSTNSEDVLTGCFFGTMRYLPFRRGLNQVFTHYAVSEDPQVAYIFSSLLDEEFDFEFWKRSENGWLRLCIKQKQDTLEVICRVLTCLQHFILI